jgi:hypothetical protein
MRHLLGLCIIITLCGFVQPVAGADLKVLTQNQYLGADLTPVFTANNEAMFNEAAVAASRRWPPKSPRRCLILRDSRRFTVSSAWIPAGPEQAKGVTTHLSEAPSAIIWQQY